MCMEGDALLWEVDLIKGRELEFSVECEVPGNLQVKMEQDVDIGYEDWSQGRRYGWALKR